MSKILVSVILSLALSFSGFVGSLFQQVGAPDLPETISYSQSVSSDTEQVFVLSKQDQNLDKPVLILETQSVIVFEQDSLQSDEEEPELIEPVEEEQLETEAAPIIEPTPEPVKKAEKALAAKTESKPVVVTEVAVAAKVEEPVHVSSPVVDDKENEQVDESIPHGSVAVAVPVVKPVDEIPVVIEDKGIFDLSQISSGILGIRYLNPTNKRVRLLIDKEGTRYTYNLKGDNSLESFPLQSGNGDYKVSIMENTQGTKYRFVLTEIIQMKLNEANKLYLGSIQMINWNENMAAINKAKELTAGTEKDAEKIKAVYEFVVRTIKYDYDKLNNLPSTYLPIIDDTLKTQKGICYDFASLTASMLRSQGIPTKLVMGYAEGVSGYHAWNEIYVESTGKWLVVDTSTDSQLLARKASYSMEKSSKLYQKVKEY